MRVLKRAGVSKRVLVRLIFKMLLVNGHYPEVVLNSFLIRKGGPWQTRKGVKQMDIPTPEPIAANQIPDSLPSCLLTTLT
jgi:hypothetical protein